jgi:hypothetical protein
MKLTSSSLHLVMVMMLIALLLAAAGCGDKTVTPTSTASIDDIISDIEPDPVQIPSDSDIQEALSLLPNHNAPVQGSLDELAKMNNFELMFSIHGNWTVKKLVQSSAQITDIDPVMDIKYQNVKWAGTTFTGTEDGGSGKINGTVSEDGSTLVKLTLSISMEDNMGQQQVLNFTFSNVPLHWPVETYKDNPNTLTTVYDGSGLNNYITKFSGTSDYIYGNQKIATITYDKPDWLNSSNIFAIIFW